MRTPILVLDIYIKNSVLVESALRHKRARGFVCGLLTNENLVLKESWGGQSCR